MHEFTSGIKKTITMINKYFYFIVKAFVFNTKRFTWKVAITTKQNIMTL